MNYAEEFFKQMVKKNNTSYAGFYILISFIGLTLVAVYYLLKIIIESVRNMLETKTNENIKREAHERAVIKLLKLLDISDNVINFNIIKSHTNRSTGELTQYINFVVFNSYTRNVEIINSLVNEILHNTLEICNKRDQDLKGTRIIKNYDIDKIRENLCQITSENIILRYF